MLWIVGKTFSEFRNYLDERLIPYGVFWDAALPLPESITASVIPLDFSNIVTLKEQLERCQSADVTSIIVAGYENYVLPAAHIAAYYDIPGPNIEAAAAATDKALMRQKFIDFDPSLSPGYAEVHNWQDVEDFMRRHSFPVMLKPASLMKSLLITKSANIDELKHNYRQTTDEISRLYSKYNVGQAPKIIIEEFLNGTMHTVAGFADANGEPLLIPGIVDCITGQEIGHDDNFLYSRALPTKLSRHDQDNVLRVAQRGIQALGLSSCPAHIEIMLTGSGPKIIEIGARLGGYRPRMYEYAAGIDLQLIMLEIAAGQAPNIQASAERLIAVYELFPLTEGMFQELTFEADLRALSSLRHLSIKADTGTVVGRSSQGHKTAAVVILGNENTTQFEQDRLFMETNVRVQLQ
jgi:biotin carboxylase